MHEALVSNWALPFLSLIRANQTPNARRMPLNPSRPPSRLLRHPARRDPVQREFSTYAYRDERSIGHKSFTPSLRLDLDTRTSMLFGPPIVTSGVE